MTPYYIIDDIQQAWRYRNGPKPRWTQDSKEYLQTHMPNTASYRSDLRLHRAVAPLVKQGGLILEFGVATGRTIRHWARMFPDHDIWGFDGFEGIYEDFNHLPAGHFARKDLPQVPLNVKLVVGRVESTLKSWLDNHPGPVSLLHMDMDLYAPTRLALDLLKPRIGPGTIIVFDEYWNHQSWREHEHRAWQEMNIKSEYIGWVYGGNYQPVALRVL